MIVAISTTMIDRPILESASSLPPLMGTVGVHSPTRTAR